MKQGVYPSLPLQEPENDPQTIDECKQNNVATGYYLYD